MAKLTVQELKGIIAAKAAKRQNWMTLWQEIGDNIFQRKNNVLTKRAQGEDKQVEIYDNTGPQSLELWAGIMMSVLMSIEEPWFEHTSGDEELDQKENIKKYLQKATRTIHSMLANSNFYTEAHEMLLDIGGFGTNIFGIEEDPEEVVRFFAKFIGESYIGENARGKVDELYMEYEYSARQIVSEYGDKNLPKAVKQALEKKEEKLFKVLHCVYPVDSATGKANRKGHKYYSQHVMLEEDHELKIGGFTSFPYPTPRYSKATGEDYGRSLGMIALPEVKVLNKMVEITLIGAEKVIDPPLQAPDDGFMTQINTFPASVSYYRSGSTDRIEPIFNDAKVDFGFQMIQEKQSKIRDAFYINQMMLQPKSGNPATATETTQMIQQSMRFMGSFMARMQKEFLQPTIDRVTEIAFKRGVLKKEDIPQELRGKQFTVKYTSFIAKSQRMGSLQNILHFYQAIEPLINADPSTRFYIRGGGGIKTIANILGIPMEMINDDKTVAAMQAQAAAEQKKLQEAQVNQQQMDAVAKASQAAKTVSPGG